MIIEKFKKLRTIEVVTGFLGGILGLSEGIFALLSPPLVIYGISSVLASIVGLIGVFYINQNSKISAILLIISSIWLLLSLPTTTGILGAVLLGVAGLMKLEDWIKGFKKQERKDNESIGNVKNRGNRMD